MKLLSEYQSDAWDRRIARDYPRMPALMKRFFVLNHYVNTCNVWVSSLLLVASLVSMIKVVSGTWLTGGSALISESSWFTPMVLLFASAAAVRWVIPVISNFTFHHWYYTSRSKF